MNEVTADRDGAAWPPRLKCAATMSRNPADPTLSGRELTEPSLFHSKPYKLIYGRKEVSEIKPEKTKRMNLNVPVALHNAFKSLTAAGGKDMTSVLLDFIKAYVAKASSKRRRP